VKSVQLPIGGLGGAQTEELAPLATGGSETLWFMKTYTGFARNPVTRNKRTPPGTSEITYNKFRLSRLVTGESGHVCTGCGKTAPSHVHARGCNQLAPMRGNLQLDSLNSDPGAHVRFLQQALQGSHARIDRVPESREEQGGLAPRGPWSRRLDLGWLGARDGNFWH